MRGRESQGVVRGTCATRAAAELCNFRLKAGTLISDLILQSASHSRTYNVNQGQGPNYFRGFETRFVLWKPLSKGCWDTKS